MIIRRKKKKKNINTENISACPLIITNSIFVLWKPYCGDHVTFEHNFLRHFWTSILDVSFWKSLLNVTLRHHFWMSWLTCGWESVKFGWYFHTFHENGDGVLLKIKPKTPTKKLETVLFTYLLTNTNIAGI